MRCVNDDIAKRIGGHSMFIVAAQAVAEQVTGRVVYGWLRYGRTAKIVGPRAAPCSPAAARFRRR